MPRERVLFGPPPWHVACRGARAANGAIETTKQKSAAAVASARRQEAAFAKAAPTIEPRRNLLAVFAHDIRTALTGILALGELLASSNLGERERRWADGIKDSAEHLASLTTLVIDAAKAECRARSFCSRRCSGRGVSSKPSGETLAARAETKGLRGGGDDRRGFAGGSDRRCGAVARRAGKPHRQCGEVHCARRGVLASAVAAAPRRGRAKLTFVVTDSGIGLKPAEIRRLFRPFAQASAEIARRYGGAGLGLAVVKVLARLMGGDLTVASAPGRGSRFSLSAVLPVAPAEAVGGAPRGKQACRRAGSRSSAPRIIPTAASSSTPFSPSSAITPTSSAPARKPLPRCRAATTSC